MSRMYCVRTKREQRKRCQRHTNAELIWQLSVRCEQAEKRALNSLSVSEDEHSKRQNVNRHRCRTHRCGTHRRRTHATIRRSLPFCHFSGGARELHLSSFGAGDRLHLTISDLGRNDRCATNLYFQAPCRAIGRIGRGWSRNWRRGWTPLVDPRGR